MTTIYIITNDFNDSVYVGQTKKTLKERFRAHLIDSRKKRLHNRPFYKDLSEMGKKHFSIQELEKCKDADGDERERRWIKYFSDRGSVYNIALGGKGKPLYDHAEIVDALRNDPSPLKIAREIGCSRDVVQSVAKEEKIPVYHIQVAKWKEKGIHVTQFDKNGNRLQSFSSFHEAAIWCAENGFCKMNRSIHYHISECAAGKRKSAFGFVWKYA